jgi:hypothetical protein
MNIILTVSKYFQFHFLYHKPPITYLKSHISYLISFVFLSSCNIINPPEQIPAYLKIDSFQLQITNSSLQGSNSSNITDAWVFIDNNILGVYALPAELPVLEVGQHSIRLAAAIKENGYANIRNTYPFYAPYDIDVELKSDNSINITPTIQYREDAIFLLMENFEGSGINLAKLSGDVDIKKTQSTVFEGLNSGEISFDATTASTEIASTQEFSLKLNNNQMFLELNYKCDMEFLVGLMDTKSLKKNYILGVLPKKDWNKIYINLESAVSALSADKYKLIFQAIKPENTNTASVFLDNIKVITN